MEFASPEHPAPSPIVESRFLSGNIHGARRVFKSSDFWRQQLQHRGTGNATANLHATISAAVSNIGGAAPAAANAIAVSLRAV